MADITSLPEAIAALVRDGDAIAMEGFTHLIPHAAGHEVIRQGRRGLAPYRITPDIIYDQLIGSGVASKLVFSWGLRGKGVTRVITDPGVIEPDAHDRELALTHLHPGVTTDRVREATGWPLRIADPLRDTKPPTREELNVLRDLRERTERAHAERAR